MKLTLNVLLRFAACIMICSCLATAVYPEPAHNLSTITAVADSVGFSWQWERGLSRLTCMRQGMTVRFYEGKLFCSVNGEIRRLAEAPVRIGESLYLPMTVLAKLLPGTDTIPEPVVSGKSTTTSDLRSNNIISVNAEKKSNGTLLSIKLADSLPLDITYYYPNLTFNFFGGKLDTSAIRMVDRVGVIDSIFSTRFSVSSQITAMLAREIEEPMVDYVEDTRTVMISLWPKKTVSTVRKTEKPKVDEKPATTVIVLDPGHGGKDPGAISNSGIQEKDIVLAIGLKVSAALKKKPGLTVHMTRGKDVFVPLSDRTKFANEKKAHLFVSIHANSIGGNEKRKQSTNGYKIYFLSQAKNEEDKLAAMRENAVIELEEKPQEYSELKNVLIEMAGNEYLRESQELCILIEQKFGSSLGKKMSKLNKGVGQANFWVLNGAFMPSVLIETGFLSHKKEEKLLNDSAFQEQMAKAITDAVVNFCERFDGVGL